MRISEFGLRNEIKYRILWNKEIRMEAVGAVREAQFEPEVLAYCCEH